MAHGTKSTKTWSGMGLEVLRALRGRPWCGSSTLLFLSSLLSSLPLFLDAYLYCGGYRDRRRDRARNDGNYVRRSVVDIENIAESGEKSCSVCGLVMRAPLRFIRASPIIFDILLQDNQSDRHPGMVSLAQIYISSTYMVQQ